MTRSLLVEQLFGNDPNETCMTLSNMHVFSIYPDALSSLSNLVILELSNNNLRTLNESVFNSLTNLRVLFLDSNQLTALTPSQFSNLSMLTSLDLSNNSLTTLDRDIFSACRNLTHLKLASNKFSFVGNFLDGLTQLTKLDLRHNHLFALSSFVAIKNEFFLTIYIEENPISRLANMYGDELCENCMILSDLYGQEIVF